MGAGLRRAKEMGDWIRLSSHQFTLIQALGMQPETLTELSRAW